MIDLSLHPCPFWEDNGKLSSDLLQDIKPLLLLQLWGKRAQGEGSKKVQTAMTGVMALVEALEGVMQPGQYMQALLTLLQEPQEALVPRVVRLYEASLSKATDAPTIKAAMQFCDKVMLYLLDQVCKVKLDVGSSLKGFPSTPVLHRHSVLRCGKILSLKMNFYGVLDRSIAICHTALIPTGGQSCVILSEKQVLDHNSIAGTHSSGRAGFCKSKAGYLGGSGSFGIIAWQCKFWSYFDHTSKCLGTGLLLADSQICHLTLHLQILFLVSLPSVRLLIYSARKSEQDLPASALGTALEGSCLHFA